MKTYYVRSKNGDISFNFDDITYKITDQEPISIELSDEAYEMLFNSGKVFFLEDYEKKVSKPKKVSTKEVNEREGDSVKEIE